MIGRPLGFVETYCKLAHDNNGGYNVITIGKFYCEKSLTSELIQQAIDSLFKKYAILQSSIVNNDRGVLCFILNKTELTQGIIEINDINKKSLTTCIDHFLKNRFSNESLYKIQVILDSQSHQHYILLSNNHAIMDGLSAVKFINEFLMFVANPITTEQIKTNSLPRPAEVRFAKRTRLIKFVVSMLKKKFLDFRRVYLYVPYDHNSTIERITQYTFNKIEKSDLNKLLIFCKQNEITLTALLHGCLVKAIIEVMHITGNAKVVTTIPLSPPRQQAAQTTEIGCLMAPIEIINNISKGISILEISRESKTQLLKNITDACRLPYNFAATPFLQKVLNNMINKKKPVFNYFCQISNLGVIDNLLEPNKQAALEELFFFTSRNNADILISLYTATLHGELFLTFAYLYPLLSKEHAEHIIQHFYANIKSII